MANLTIAQLTEILAAGVDNADLLPLWDDTAQETKKITIAQFRTLVSTVNWSETFSSATQATSQWTPLNAAANVNAAITPKGTGALVAQIPDGTTAGGNARGQNAVDFQMVRAAANQVSSGNYSVICGGAANLNADSSSFIGGGADIQIAVSSINYNVVVGGVTQRITAGIGGRNFIGGGEAQTINGTFRNSIIGGGASNSIGGSFSGIFSGQSNTNNGTHCVVIGGQSNTVTGTYSSAVGFGNTATSFHSHMIGNSNVGSNNLVFLIGSTNTGTAQMSVAIGDSCTVSASNTLGTGNFSNAYLQGQKTHANGRFSSTGDAQAHELIWRREITGTAQTELFLDGASVAAILPATNCLWQGTIDIAAICTVVGNGTTTLGDAQGTSYKVTIKRLGATTTLVGTVQEIGTMNADPSALGVFTIDANDTNESLRIQFTPPPSAGSTTVHRVVATFRGLQIQY